MYIQADNQTAVIIKYPFRIPQDFRAMGISIRRDPPLERLAEYGIYPVTEVAQPANTVDLIYSEVDPVFNGTDWVQTYTSRATTQEERDAFTARQTAIEAAADKGRAAIIYALLAHATTGSTTELDAVKTKLQTIATNNGLTIRQVLEQVF